LVVDDSAVNRTRITSILETSGRALVVGKACDGQEAIKLVQELQPDVITLDLEMPTMDGFTFLRILRSTRPTPVIVVSSDSRAHSVFQALELGALDFVAKPMRVGVADLAQVAEDLLAKVLNAAAVGARKKGDMEVPPERETTQVRRATIRCVAVASSTGGPPAIQMLLEAFSQPPPFAVIVAQHMPPRFTEAFAERLSRRVALPVSEVKQAERILPGRAYICPGGLVTALKLVGGEVVARVSPAGPDRMAPSGDVLLSSVAEVFGAEAACAVLTGMGSDGAVGAALVERRGGRVLVEAPSTAVVPGMPQATLDLCVTARQMPLESICRYLVHAAAAIGAQSPFSR
jgi:two-component system chemotaxis response regulator CheB